MGKILCIFGLVIAALLIIFFALDIATGLMQIGSVIVDVAFIVCAAILGYLSWNAFREQL